MQNKTIKNLIKKLKFIFILNNFNLKIYIFNFLIKFFIFFKFSIKCFTYSHHFQFLQFSPFVKHHNAQEQRNFAVEKTSNLARQPVTMKTLALTKYFGHTPTTFKYFQVAERVC